MRFRIHPELPATDVLRAHSWYAQMLGLEPAMVGGEPYRHGDPIDPDDELLYVHDGARFGIYHSPYAGRDQATAARLVVDDFDRVFAELRGRGVVFLLALGSSG